MELDWVQLVVLLPTLLTVIWAVATFTLEWRRKQNDERRRLSALYVNPFLLACQELQSRIYNILKRGGMWALKAQDPENRSFPQETLYLIAQYFGWERHNFRYGPYAQDTHVFRLTEAIRSAFAEYLPRYPTSQPGGSEEEPPAGAEPFCFYRYQQKALAQIILQLGEGPAGWQAETIPYVDFQTRCDQLAESLPPVKATLDALQSSSFPPDFDPLVEGRLAEVQNYLVELLAYLEVREQFSLFLGDRKKCERHPKWIDWSKNKGWDCLLNDGST